MALFPEYMFNPFSLIRDFDDDFSGLYDDGRRYPMLLAPQQQYLRPWRMVEKKNSGSSSVINNKDEFKVNLDVQQFKPEQVTVKVVDNHLVVEGKHEERQDEHGYISRQFQRRYLLPKDVDPQAVQSSLSSDGVLSIAAPKKKTVAGNERVVPVVFTNQPSIKAEEPKKAVGQEKMQQ